MTRTTMYRWRQSLWVIYLLLLSAATLVNGKDDGNGGNGQQQKLQPCDGGVIQVTKLQVLCNSPYAYYYGNYANRNSYLCNDGDKATLSVELTVTADLDEVDIYMTMAIYANNAMIYSIAPDDLCSYIGQECTPAGSYSFTKYIQLPDGDRVQYVPEIQMAFSTSADQGYNLGGVNINCEWNDGDSSSGNSGSYVNWATSQAAEEKGVGGFLANYGILIGTIAVISIFVLVLWRQGRDRIDLPDAQQRLGFL